MIKITVGQILEAHPVLTKLFMDLLNSKLPLGASFRFGSLVRRIAPEQEAAHQMKLIVFRKHGKEKNGQIVVEPNLEIEDEAQRLKDQEERMAALNAELLPLYATEFELDARPLPLSLLDDLNDQLASAEKPQLTLAEATTLIPFFEEEK